jgi:MFS family permease
MVAGQYLSAFFFPGSIGVVGGGPLADRFGYKHTVLLSLGLAPVGLFQRHPGVLLPEAVSGFLDHDHISVLHIEKQSIKGDPQFQAVGIRIPA